MTSLSPAKVRSLTVILVPVIVSADAFGLNTSRRLSSVMISLLRSLNSDASAGSSWSASPIGSELLRVENRAVTDAWGVDSPPAVAAVEFLSRKAKNHTPAAATKATTTTSATISGVLLFLGSVAGPWVSRAAGRVPAGGRSAWAAAASPAARSGADPAVRSAAASPAGPSAGRERPGRDSRPQFCPPGLPPGFCGPPPWPGCGQPWGPLGPARVPGAVARPPVDPAPAPEVRPARSSRVHPFYVVFRAVEFSRNF